MTEKEKQNKELNELLEKNINTLISPDTLKYFNLKFSYEDKKLYLNDRLIEYKDLLDLVKVFSALAYSYVNDDV